MITVWYIAKFKSILTVYATYIFISDNLCVDNSLLTTASRICHSLYQ